MRTSTGLAIVFVLCLAATLGISYGTYTYRTNHPVPEMTVGPDASSTFLTPMGVFEEQLTTEVNGSSKDGVNFNAGSALGNLLVWFVPLGAIYWLVDNKKKSAPSKKK